jgi:polysaccharide pyruvyl transferase WcaK-like protein
MKIAFFGNYGVQNTGDDLILMGLQKKYPGSDLTIFCGNTEQVKAQFGLPSFPFFPGGMKSALKWMMSAEYRSRIRESFQTLQSMDLIVVGGGGILVDRHIEAVILWWMQLRNILCSRVAFEFVGNSLELRHWWSRWIFKPYLRKAKAVSVRDSSSQALLQSMGISSTLEEDLSSLVPLTIHRSSRKQIALALCQWGMGEQQISALRHFLQKKQREGYEVVGLAFQTSGDDDRVIFSKIDPQLLVKTSLPDILEELGKSEGLIAMRYHAVTLGLRFGIPTVALSYQDKVAGLMKDRGRSNCCVFIQNMDEQNLQELFQKAVEGAKK